MSESEPPDRLARLGRAPGQGAREARQRASRRPAPTTPRCSRAWRWGCASVSSSSSRSWSRRGWAGRIDRWLGTSPWVTIVMFFLGVAAGMVNVYRAVAGIKMPVGYAASRRDREPGSGQPRTSGTRTRNSVAMELQPAGAVRDPSAHPAAYRRRRHFLHELGAADDDRRPRGHRADRARHAQGGAGAGTRAVGRRDALRVRRRHGRHQRRARRAAVSCRSSSRCSCSSCSPICSG